ncbi:MAG: SCP2 sterol-binding domain-containing protein [Actinomycetota bacterium]|nr:SCP2 sterol-binding domain-containing protein [Actinomycetota bacterium]
MATQNGDGELGRLADVLRSCSDAEVCAALADEGVRDKALAEVFEGMVGSFRPDRAQGHTAIVHYRLLFADDDRDYTVRVEDGHCAASSGRHGEPLFTVSMKLVDFLRLFIGQLSGIQAFMSGKLKITGDLLAAQSYQRWFDRK